MLIAALITWIDGRNIYLLQCIKDSSPWILKWKNYKIKTSFVDPKGLQVQVNTAGINYMIMILILVESCL